MNLQKIIVLLIGSAFFCLTGCKVGNSASSYGLSDQAFICIESIHPYKEGVQVKVDKESTFEAKVYKPKKHKVKGDVYAIATGKRHVTVWFNGQQIYERTILLSPQQTYKIILP